MVELPAFRGCRPCSWAAARLTARRCSRTKTAERCVSCPRQGLGKTISRFSNQFTDGCARRGYFLPSTAMTESRLVIANRAVAPSSTESGFRSWSAAAATRNPCARARPSRSVSTRPEPDAGALIMQRLSDRNPVHSERSGSLGYWDDPKPAKSPLNLQKRARNVSQRVATRYSKSLILFGKEFLRTTGAK